MVLNIPFWRRFGVSFFGGELSKLMVLWSQGAMNILLGALVAHIDLYNLAYHGCNCWTLVSIERQGL